MKKIKNLMAVLMLSIAAISMTSCDKSFFDELRDTLIGGSTWRQGEYYIESLGGGEYYVENTESGAYDYFYLPPFYEFQYDRPHVAIHVSYHPYFEYGVLGWHVDAGQGRCYFIDPDAGGRWQSHKNQHRH